MSSKVFFSVIIPVYNRPELIKRSIESVLNQKFKNYELIVINDGSTDDTENSILLYKEKIQNYSQKNLGVSAARNIGIQKSKGKYLAFLDSDDLWFEDKLQKQYEYIQQNENIKIFQCNERWIRNGKRVNPGKKHIKQSGKIFKDSLKLCLVSPSAVVIKRQLFDEIGFFDEKMKVCEDYDLWLRISCKHEIFLQQDDLLEKYGGHEDQLSSSCWGMDRFRVYSMLKLLESHFDENVLNEDYKNALLEELALKLEIMILGSKKRNNDQFLNKLAGLKGKINADNCSSRDYQFLLEE